ncbi:uncharacterized protein LOC119975528 [Scyliorhinus canicula]|uniref:uncharacterized protein LOC119975528 n=1 Tax=Scyliorhinus canicula TaxID=7830 RepID=UPI0018F6E46B|nr:uncharacterized protein LOC119975528 [Scyliorhinus canicula]
MRQLLLKDTEIIALQAKLKEVGTHANQLVECKRLLQSTMRQLLQKDAEIMDMQTTANDAGPDSKGTLAGKQNEQFVECKKLLQMSMRQLLAKDIEIGRLKKSIEDCENTIRKKDTDMSDHLNRDDERTAQAKSDMSDHLKSDDERIAQANSELEKLEAIRKDVEALLRLKDEEIKYFREQAENCSEYACENKAADNLRSFRVSVHDELRKYLC